MPAFAEPLHTDIYGNREFVERLRNRGKFFDYEEKRERDLILINYEEPNATAARRRNVYEATEEFAYHIAGVAACDDLEQVTAIVDNLFTILEKVLHS